MKERTYLCIDLKSFYASVECAERGLDAMTTNLVVADMSRTEKTICLAITPSMKALGIHNRCRIFEIPPHIKYIAATPRMQLYIDYAAEIYGIYLKYISKDDIHVYSIDEAFMDVTDYQSYEFAREHPVIHFDTLTEERDYEVLAAFYWDPVPRQENALFHYYEYPELSSPEIFEEYIRQVKSYALYDTGVSTACGDKILTLSTCSYHTNNGRFVVVAVSH